MRNSKLQLKGNSVLEKIFVEKIPCYWEIREVLVVYWLKRYFIIYLPATNLFVAIWLAAAIKVNQEQLATFYGKTVSVEVADQNKSAGGILQNGVLKAFAKFK